MYRCRNFDPYFAIAVRRLLSCEDLTVKLFSMQILAEGTATVAFRFLRDGGLDPVLDELLTLIEKDEVRHVGFGVSYLPQRLDKMKPEELVVVRNTILGIGDLFGLAQVRMARHYRALGIEPRELLTRADRMLTEIGKSLGTIRVPTRPTSNSMILPIPSTSRSSTCCSPPRGWRTFTSRFVRGLIDAGARILPS